MTVTGIKDVIVLETGSVRPAPSEDPAQLNDRGARQDVHRSCRWRQPERLTGKPDAQHPWLCLEHQRWIHEQGLPVHPDLDGPAGVDLEPWRSPFEPAGKAPDLARCLEGHKTA